MFVCMSRLSASSHWVCPQELENTKAFPKGRNTPRGLHSHGYCSPPGLPIGDLSQRGSATTKTCSPWGQPWPFHPKSPPIRACHSRVVTTQAFSQNDGSQELSPPIFIPWSWPNLSLPPRFDLLSDYLSVCRVFQSDRAVVYLWSY